MYCRNCGCEISENTKSCPQCGESQREQIQPAENKIPSVSSADGNMNHDVLVQYLSDVRTLEIAKMKLENKIKEYTDRCTRLGIPQSFSPCDEFSSLPLAGAVTLAVFALIMLLLSAIDLSIPCIVVAIISGMCSIACFAYYFYRKSEYDQKFIHYNNALSNDKKRVEQELREKSALETELTAMQNELRNAEDLLLDAYSINIIPKQYRDIYAAFYLYDYLSTSAASLEAALLHYNLEELKARLNEVIRQQSEMLLEMAIQSAHLADIRTNTEKMMRHAASTEQNTALAAQYAQIAANNAEANAWINIAQYIKD